MYLSFTLYFIYKSMSPSLGMKFDIATEKFYLIFFLIFNLFYVQMIGFVHFSLLKIFCINSNLSINIKNGKECRLYPSYYDPCIFSKNFNDFWLLFPSSYKYFVINVGAPTWNDSCILSKSFNDFWLLFLTIYKYFVINVGPPTCKCIIKSGIITLAYLRTIDFW